MKQHDRKQQTKRKILNNALNEFAEKGYERSSVNNIYDSAQGISKGIIYHYFSSKDELFLSCVCECFLQLKDYIEQQFMTNNLSENIQDCITEYYLTRRNFFEKYPRYQRIFFEAVIIPPVHLKEEIQLLRQPMEKLNIQILENILSKRTMRIKLDQRKAAEVLINFIHFMDVQYSTNEELSIQDYEKRDLQLLDIFLYGILEEEK